MDDAAKTGPAVAARAVLPIRRLGPSGYAVCLAGIVARELLRFVHQKERFLSALVRPLDLAVHLRRGLSQRPRRLDPAAVRNLYSLRGLHHAGPCRDDPALQRHAVVLVDGVRPRGRLDARALDEPVSALVPPSREARRRRRRIAHPGLRLPRRRTPVGGRDSGRGAVPGVPGVPPLRIHARRDRALPVLPRAPARKLRQRDELRHLPDVLRLLRPLPLWRIREASEPLYIICLANPFTHAVEMVRHALYGSFEPISTSVALATTLAFFVLAVLAYDPGHGTMARRGGPKGEAR